MEPRQHTSTLFTLADRHYDITNSIEDDIQTSHSTNCFYDLNHIAAIKVSGSESASFLQGQISCDVDKVDVNQATLGCYCNTQGRIISLFTLFKIADDSYLLLMPKDTLKLTGKTLKRYAKFSKVTVESCHEYRIFGISVIDDEQNNTQLKSLLPTEEYAIERLSGCIVCHVDINRYLCLSPNTQDTVDDSPCLPAIDPSQTLGSFAWHYRQIVSQQMELYPSTQEHFLPHRLNLQQGSAISFNKGCYMGQEIIARMHYRAKLKHGVYLRAFDMGFILNPGQAIFDQAGKKNIGEIIDVSPIGGGRQMALISLLMNHENDKSFTIEEQSIPVILQNATFSL